jgi:hypothetical protein
MRADPEHRVTSSPDRIACAIHLDLEPGFSEPGAEEVVRGVLLRRVADASRPDRVQLIEALEDAY